MVHILQVTTNLYFKLGCIVGIDSFPSASVTTVYVPHHQLHLIRYLRSPLLFTSALDENESPSGKCISCIFPVIGWIGDTLSKVMFWLVSWGLALLVISQLCINYQHKPYSPLHYSNFCWHNPTEVWWNPNRLPNLPRFLPAHSATSTAARASRVHGCPHWFQ